jgi:hypothetical protein
VARDVPLAPVVGERRLVGLGGVLIVLLVGGASYSYSWIVTGNPVLPLLNDVFQSPYFGALRFDDPRWHAGLGVDTLWRLTFRTAAYNEGWDGAYQGHKADIGAYYWVLSITDRFGKEQLMKGNSTLVR